MSCRGAPPTRALPENRGPGRGLNPTAAGRRGPKTIGRRRGSLRAVVAASPSLRGHCFPATAAWWRGRQTECCMQRAQKTQSIKKLEGVFASSGAIVVTHYLGLTVAETEDLRGRLRKEGAAFKVVKNRLAQKALNGASEDPH